MKQKKILSIALAAVAVLLVAGILLGIFLMGNHREEPPPATDPTETTAPPPTEPGPTQPPPTEPSEPPEPDTATKILDPMDEIGPWIGTALEVREDESGRFLMATGRDEQGSAVMSRTFEPPIDLRGYANGYLHLRIYVEDLGKLTGGQVEFTSSGGPDSQELSWELGLYLKKSGWNELWLPFASAARVGGEIDLLNVNYLRIYGILDGNCLFGVDQLELTNEEPQEESHLDEKGQFVLDEVESLGPWSGSAPAFVAGGPVGKGYVRAEKLEGDALVLTRNFDPLDMTAFRKGYLHLWVYVKDLNKVTGGQIELSSAGTADKAETAWDVLAYVKKSGWNELYLPVSQGIQTGGGADFSAVNYIRIFILTGSGNALGVDYVCMSQTAPPEPSRIDANNQFVIDEVEKMETWGGSAPYLSSKNPPVGKVFLCSDTRDEAGSAVFCRSLTDLDASGYKNGYLHMWLYVQNVDLITGGQIELGSAGEADHQETSWDVGALSLKNGWNELYLPISQANRVDGGANFSRLNFLRIFIITSQNQRVGIDYICLSHTAPAQETPKDENGNYIIDHVEGIAPWSGFSYVYNTANGYTDGAGWLSASTSAPADIVFFRNFAPADLREYKYLHLWVYVDKVEHLTGGMVEITSAGEVDEEELYWPLTSYVTKDGWNELYLPFAEALTQGDRAADRSRLNCLRVVAMMGAAGGNAGIDEIYATNTEPPKPETPPEVPDRVYIHRGESLEKLYGTAPELSTVDPPAGSGWIKTGTDVAPVVVIVPDPPVNLRGYESAGYLHLWLYVEDAGQVTGGQIELTSAGEPDNQETSWEITADMLKDGWNQLELPLAQANHVGGQTNYGAVDYVRIYVNFASPSYFGLDEVYVHGDREVPGEDKSLEELVAEATERSVLFAGSEEMRAALAAVLDRAAQGKPVTLAVLGDSITAGAVAPAGEEWAALVRNYLEGLDGDKDNGNVTLVNAGVGSTEAVYGVSRLERDVLARKPDLVIVDFGTNDYGLPYGPEAYEGILTKLLQAKVPVLNSNVCPRNGNNIQEKQIPINQAYGVPQVSFRSAYYDLSLTTTVVGLRAGDIWSPDNVHPTAQGHKLLADLLVHYLASLRGTPTGALTGALPEKVTNNGFADAILVENTTQDSPVQVTLGDGWTADYEARIFQLSTEGWQTRTVGSTLTFKVNSGYFYMFFALTPESGDLEIAVDGQVKETINWAYQGTGYMNPYHIVHLGAVAEHTVTLTLRDNPHVEKDWFGICAVGAANFTGYEVPEEPGLIDHITPDSSWVGDGNTLTYETEGGYTEGAGWLRTERKDNGNVVFFATFPEKDLSAYANGYLHLWLYVEDLETLRDTGGMIEITSAGTVDKEELSWSVKNYVTQNGWNELYLPVTEGVSEGGAINLAKVNCMRVVGFFQETGGVMGIDEITMRAEKEYPRVMIHEGESLEKLYGTEPVVLATENPPVGNGWIKTGTDNAPVLVIVPEPPVDIRGYEDTGYLHLWLYVEDAGQVTGGQIELTSSGAADKDETSWDITPGMLESGWNELKLLFAKANTIGQTDYSAINYLRIYVNLATSGYFGLDEVYVSDEGPSVDDTARQEAIREATERSVLFEGSQEVKSAIATVLDRAKKGEKVTVAALGYSFAAGAANQPGQEWVSLLGVYLENLDGDPNNKNVTMVNAGVGSTEAAYAVTRLERDVLAYDPDLVILEIGGGNDENQPYPVEAYEGILDKLTQLGIPAINSNVCQPNGETLQEQQKPVNRAYGVPQVSFYSAYYDLAFQTDIVGLRDEDIWSELDYVHPSPIGHRLIADLMISYLQQHILDAGVAPGEMTKTLPEKVTYNGFADAILVENTTNDPRVKVDLTSGWTADYNAEIYELRTKGWQTSTVGSSITFEVEGGYFYMFFALTPKSGDLAITVDGADYGLINWAYQGTGYMNPYHILHLGPVAKHTVTLTLRDNPNVAEDWFGICAVGAANFEGYEVKEEPGVIDHVTMTSAWIGGKYHTTDGYAEDADWILAKAAGQTDLVLGSNFQAKDLSAYGKGYLHLWLYVEKLEELRNGTGGMIEISSAGVVDQQEISWPIVPYVTQNGWNELYLPVEKGEAQGGNIDLSRVNCMRIVGFAGANGGAIGVDEIYMVAQKPGEPEPDPEPDPVLNMVEDADSWLGGAVYVTTGGYEEGAGWLRTDTKDVNHNLVISSKQWPAKDFTAFKDGYLHMWIYAERVSDFTGGMVEITSAGHVDEQEISWQLLEYVKKDGWNEVYLPLAEGTPEGGDIDFSRVDCFRIVAFTGENNGVLGIDELYMVTEKPAEPQPDPDPDPVLNMVEDADSWLGGAVYVTTGGHEEGAGWLRTDTKDVNKNLVISSKQWPAKDFTAYKDGYLHMWIYAEKVSDFTGGMVEITSGGVVDKEEISWQLLEYVKKDGWNEVYLPLAKGTPEGGDIDFSRVDCFRIVAFTGENNGVLGIDELYMVTEKPAEPQPDPDPVLNRVESADDWLGGVTYETENGYTAGAGWIRTDQKDGGNNLVISSKEWAAKDFSAYEGGYLHMWIYVEKLEEFIGNGGMVEISSAGVVDEEEISWPLKTYVTKDGWNEVYLPLAQGEHQGERTFDLSRVNCFRMVGFAGESSGVIGIDELYMVKEKPADPEPEPDPVLDRITGTEGWSGLDNLTYETENGYKPDAGWLRVERTGANQDLVISSAFEAKDFSAYEGGYLHMWIYVSGLEGFRGNGGMIEISSAGVVDNQEIYWPLKDYVTGNGWNEVYLPLSGAIPEGVESFDITRVNCMRIVGFAGIDGGVLGIDELYMTKEREDPVLNRITGTDGWVGGENSISYETANGYTETAGWLRASRDTAGDLVFFSSFTPKNFSAYRGGNLHMWIYVSDVNALQGDGGMVEITSSGTVDEQELYWPLKDYVTKTGWNEVRLPLSKGIAQGNAPFDITRVNCLRVVGHMGEGTTVLGIDDITMEKP